MIVIVSTSLPTPSTSSTATQKTRPPSTSTMQLPNHGLPKLPPPLLPLRVDPSSTQLILVGSLIMIPTSFVQLRTNKVINFDNLRTRIFIKILTSDSESETLKLFIKGVSFIFPHFFGVAKFLGIFNTPKSLVNQPSLDQFCTIYDPDVVDVWKNKPGSNYICFRETLTWKGYDHVTVSAKFPLLETDFWLISDQYFGKILVGSNRGNKKESIGIFFVFLAIFSGTGQIFGV